MKRERNKGSETEEVKRSKEEIRLHERKGMKQNYPTHERTNKPVY